DGSTTTTAGSSSSSAHSILPKWNTQNGLRGWIEKGYGVENTQLLLADTLLKKSEKEQLKTFQSFLDWFRDEFPYFHDKCNSCGASCKDDPAPETLLHKGEQQSSDQEVNEQNNNNEPSSSSTDYYDEEHDEFSFLGYVYPTPRERLGNASRTELYRCRSCSSYTRFPRYNKALWVTSTQQGRCGEYSMLLYRMLRVLGYDKIRWVVDWADHVWVEVWLGDGVHYYYDGRKSSESNNGRWVHLDPCEAAVDIPLLYESWGKNQTYIVAFHDPFYLNSKAMDPLVASLLESNDDTLAGGVGASSLGLLESEKDIHASHRFPPVEDITRQYTSDEAQVIEDRRGIAAEPVSDAIGEVSRNMVQLLHKMMQR
ncbi:hypothetical protein ACHAXR_002057, partial [Thalassiosira sp. AJA248-18]